MPDRDQLIRQLFDRHARGVGSYFLARLGDAELAEELVARVFAKVVDRFEQCRRSTAAWLWSIARNELASHLRGRRALGQIDEQIAAVGQSPAADAERNEDASRMQLALDQLDEPAASVVFMKFFQQMGNTEIAEATGLTAANVGVILHRAIKRLRAIMEPDAAAENKR